MRYLFIILLLFAHHTHAQGINDVQNAHLKGPVKSTRQEQRRIAPKTDGGTYRSLMIDISYYDTAGMLTIDTSLGLTGDTAGHLITVFHYSPRVAGKNTANGYLLKNNGDTLRTTTRYYSYNDTGLQTRCERVSISKKDNDTYVNTYENVFYKDGQLDKTYFYLGKDDTQSCVHHYGAHTDTFIFYKHWRGKQEFNYMQIRTFDSTGNKISEVIYVGDDATVVDYYFYSDGPEEPKYPKQTHSAGTFRTNYIYYTIWNKDRYGNYLNRNRYDRDATEYDRWEIEYYK